MIGLNKTNDFTCYVGGGPRQKLRLLSVILVGICVIFTANTFSNIDIFDIDLASTFRILRREINTERCNIAPYLLDDSIISFVDYPLPPRCRNAALELLGSNRTTIWINFDEAILNYYAKNNDVVSCCYQSFFRPSSEKYMSWVELGWVDNRVKYGNCVVFKDYIKVKHEFVRVECSVNNFNSTPTPIYKQFFLFTPMKNFSKHGDKTEILNHTAFNVLIVGIDSFSELDFLQTMPKTANYLDKKGAVKMLGYNKVGFSTYFNLVPILTGLNDKELRKLCLPHGLSTFDACPFVWKLYKQAGYYTVFAEDGSSYATFNYYKPGFGVPPTDYYTRTFFHEAEKYIGSESGFCMNNMYYYQVILNYIEGITRQLKSRRLFGLFWENSMTRNGINHAIRMDDDYVKMFKDLETSDYLNNTIVIFMSGRGVQKGHPFRINKEVHLKESLPFLYLMIPPSFVNKYKAAYNNLRQNSKLLTTPFDVHESLLDLINPTRINDNIILNRSASYDFKRGISLFLKIPTNRTCRSAYIDDEWCICVEKIKLSKNDPIVVEAAHFIVKTINSLLDHYKHCATLELLDVLEGVLILSDRDDLENVGEDLWTKYILMIRINPSKAVVMAVLRQNSKDQTWQLIGDPSRLSEYGSHSGWCIDDYDLKNFCYCIS